MKCYYYVLTVLCLIICNTVCAQLTLKPAVGINFTDFSKDPTTGKYKSKVGYQIGGTVAIGQKFYFEPGLFYLQKSTEYQTDSVNAQDIKFDISGFRIPVGVGINLLGDEKTMFALHAHGGFSAFILTSVKDLDKDDFKKASWGVYAGAGVDISIIFVDLQYEWSLTDISDIQNVDVGKSRSFFINAGVRIRL